MTRGIQNPPKTPHRPQGPRPAGAERPINCELSPSLRMRICQAHADGLGYKAIARQLSNYNITRDTVRYTLSKEAERVSGISKPREGRPRKLTEKEKNMFVKEVRENPSRTMRELHSELAPHVSMKTFKRALRSRNMKKWRKLRRPLLEEEHADARLKWVCYFYLQLVIIN